jgi:peptide/nickel transport system substrate-binding protein
MLPGMPGAAGRELPGNLANPAARAARVRTELQLCRRPGGFAVTIGYPAADPVQGQAASALAAGLRDVGITAALKGLPGVVPAGYAAAAAYARAHSAGIVLGRLDQAWPSALGWLGQIAGDPSGTGLRDPAVTRLLAAMSAPGIGTRAYSALAARAAAQVMTDALVLPEVYVRAVLYRSPGLTNVYVQPAYGTYNYAVLGASRP